MQAIVHLVFRKAQLRHQRFLSVPSALSQQHELLQVPLVDSLELPRPHFPAVSFLTTQWLSFDVLHVDA